MIQIKLLPPTEEVKQVSLFQVGSRNAVWAPVFTIYKAWKCQTR